MVCLINLHKWELDCTLQSYPISVYFTISPRQFFLIVHRIATVVELSRIDIYGTNKSYVIYIPFTYFLSVKVVFHTVNEISRIPVEWLLPETVHLFIQGAILACNGTGSPAGLCCIQNRLRGCWSCHRAKGHLSPCSVVSSSWANGTP